MKAKLSILLFLIGFFHTGKAQSGGWVWMLGPNTINGSGNYGTLQVSASTNVPPSRYDPGYWTDTAGNFWMYGGTFLDDSGYLKDYCDLWKFDPVTLLWTWMNGCNNNDSIFADFSPVIAAPKGIYDSQNAPGSLGEGMFTWTTSDNHLWLYGGSGYFIYTGYYLWQYDPVINQWAWMGGFGTPAKYGVIGVADTSNRPGERYNANSAWVDDNGNLWLFGGQIGGLNVYNDVWKYDISSGIWTWMSGSDTLNSHGSYGELNIPSLNHYPWSRATSFQWKDNSGNFWLTGGTGENTNLLQDVWKFNPQTLEWTWVKGLAEPDNTSAVGGKCDTSYQNKEGGRFENTLVWKVCDDLILNYGGFMNFYPAESYDDIWGYIPSLNEWIKIGDALGTVATYGTQGVPSPSNYPPPRYGSAGFVDKQGGLWMFGGANNNYSIFYNDLWKYTIDSSCIPVPVCNLINSIPVIDKSRFKFDVSPNPASDYVMVDAVAGINGEIEVLDIMGNELMKYRISNTENRIPVAMLPQGIYFIKINDEWGRVGVGKFVKE